MPQGLLKPGLGQDKIDGGLGPVDFRLEKGHLGVQDVGVQGHALLEPFHGDAEILLRLGDGLTGDTGFLPRLAQGQPALGDLEDGLVAEELPGVPGLGQLGLGLAGLACGLPPVPDVERERTSTSTWAAPRTPPTTGGRSLSAPITCLPLSAPHPQSFHQRVQGPP